MLMFGFYFVEFVWRSLWNALHVRWSLVFFIILQNYNELFSFLWVDSRAIIYLIILVLFLCLFFMNYWLIRYLLIYHLFGYGILIFSNLIKLGLLEWRIRVN